MGQANDAYDVFEGSKYYDQFLNSFVLPQEREKLTPDLNKRDISHAIYFHLCKMKYAGWRHRIRFNRGVKHSLSEIFQDVIAFYLKAYLPPSYEVELEVAKDKLRPDIVIKKHGQYHFILEMKTNIGYNRSSPGDGNFEDRITQLSKAFEISTSNIIYVFEEHSNVNKEFSAKYWDEEKECPSSPRPNARPYSFIYPLFHNDDPYYWKWGKGFDRSSQIKSISEKEIMERALRSVVTPFEDVLKLIQSS